MKSYGHYRHDKIQCKYGCCQLKRGSNVVNWSATSNRSRRKTARQAAKKGIFSALLENN